MSDARFRRERSPARSGSGPLPLIIGGGLGGVLLAGCALASGLGWVAGLCTYSCGSSAIVFALAVAAADRPRPAPRWIAQPLRLGSAFDV